MRRSTAIVMWKRPSRSRTHSCFRRWHLCAMRSLMKYRVNGGYVPARMRLLFRRCVVLLLAVALIGGISAQLRLIAAMPSPEHRHTFGPASHHEHNQADILLCCSWSLICHSPTMLAPKAMGPAIDGTAIRAIPGQSAFLRGQVLSPEPKPPRPSALI